MRPIHFAVQNRHVNAAWPAYGASLKEYMSYIHEGLQHGFHNDTTPRFDLDGAELAQERPLRSSTTIFEISTNFNQTCIDSRSMQTAENMSVLEHRFSPS